MRPPAAALLLTAVATVAAAQARHVDTWLAAAAQHEPGTWDAAAIAVSSWSVEELDAVLRALPRGRGRPADLDRTLIRGAMLHADVAMLAPQGHVRPLGGPGSRPRRPVLLDVDGQHAGVAYEPADWDFGRRLLAALDDGPAQHAAARLWYRGTLAAMARSGQLAAVSPHFEHARKLFPNDPEILAIGGWLNEALASPSTRAVVDSARTIVRPDASTIRPAPNIPGRTQALAQAHDLFSRALAADPAFTEARIHRGRVAFLRGRLEESAGDLERAVEEAREPLLRYLAALFLGGTREAIGDLDSARAAYARASQLYPRAQSPHLALSRLASRGGDPARALRHVQQLLAIPAGDPNRGDPLWVYQMGPGRHTTAWLEELHRVIKEAGPR